MLCLAWCSTRPRQVSIWCACPCGRGLSPLKPSNHATQSRLAALLVIKEAIPEGGTTTFAEPGADHDIFEACLPLCPFRKSSEKANSPTSPRPNTKVPATNKVCDCSIMPKRPPRKAPAAAQTNQYLSGWHAESWPGIAECLKAATEIPPGRASKVTNAHPH
jgi:hypothetical protein